MMNSKIMIYDKTEKMYKSKWILNLNEMCSLLFFNEQQMEYRKVCFISRYINDHIRYLYDNHRPRLQELLDNGKLYLYLNRLERKANHTVHSQIEKWLQTDKEYRQAKAVGDVNREVGLYNNLKVRAEEIMYQSIIYV